MSTFGWWRRVSLLLIFEHSLLRGIQQLRGSNFANFWPPSSGEKWTFYILSTIGHVTPLWNFYWTPIPSSCSRSYWMTPFGYWDFTPFAFALWSLEQRRRKLFLQKTSFYDLHWSIIILNNAGSLEFTQTSLDILQFSTLLSTIDFGQESRPSGSSFFYSFLPESALETIPILRQKSEWVGEALGGWSEK